MEKPRWPDPVEFKTLPMVFVLSLGKGNLSKVTWQRAKSFFEKDLLGWGQRFKEKIKSPRRVFKSNHVTHMLVYMYLLINLWIIVHSVYHFNIFSFFVCVTVDLFQHTSSIKYLTYKFIIYIVSRVSYEMIKLGDHPNTTKLIFPIPQI